MKNKKRTLLVAALAIMLVAGASFTYAYFTDSKESTNVITMGNVAITLEEPVFTKDNAENKISNVLPNQKITKDPTITLNTNSNDAYIRTKITYTGLTAEQTAQLEAGMNIDAAKWIKGTDGYYYYNVALTQENNKTVLFDTVTIPEHWGIEMATKEFNIVVKAEAIQKDNFTPSLVDGKIVNWLDTNGAPITAL